MELNRRTLLETLGVVLASGAMANASDLQSALYDSKHVQNEAHPFGSQQIYCDGETSGLKRLVVGSLLLKPGQQPHPPHTHPDEELLIVTEGSGEITLNGKASAALAGTVMYVTPNYLHGIVNTGDAPLTFYFIKWVGK